MSIKLLTLLSKRKLAHIVLVYIIKVVKNKMVPFLLRIQNYKVFDARKVVAANQELKVSKRNSVLVEIPEMFVHDHDTTIPEIIGTTCTHIK